MAASSSAAGLEIPVFIYCGNREVSQNIITEGSSDTADWLSAVNKSHCSLVPITKTNESNLEIVLKCLQNTKSVVQNISEVFILCSENVIDDVNQLVKKIKKLKSVPSCVSLGPRSVSEGDALRFVSSTLQHEISNWFLWIDANNFALPNLTSSFDFLKQLRDGSASAIFLGAERPLGSPFRNGSDFSICTIDSSSSELLSFLVPSKSLPGHLPMPTVSESVTMRCDVVFGSCLFANSSLLKIFDDNFDLQQIKTDLLQTCYAKEIRLQNFYLLVDSTSDDNDFCSRFSDCRLSDCLDFNIFKNLINQFISKTEDEEGTKKIPFWKTDDSSSEVWPLNSSDSVKERLALIISGRNFWAQSFSSTFFIPQENFEDDDRSEFEEEEKRTDQINRQIENEVFEADDDEIKTDILNMVASVMHRKDHMLNIVLEMKSMRLSYHKSELFVLKSFLPLLFRFAEAQENKNPGILSSAVEDSGFLNLFESFFDKSESSHFELYNEFLDFVSTSHLPELDLETKAPMLLAHPNSLSGSKSLSTLCCSLADATSDEKYFGCWRRQLKTSLSSFNEDDKLKMLKLKILNDNILDKFEEWLKEDSDTSEED